MLQDYPTQSHSDKLISRTAFPLNNLIFADSLSIANGSSFITVQYEATSFVLSCAIPSSKVFRLPLQEMAVRSYEVTLLKTSSLSTNALLEEGIESYFVGDQGL